MKSTPNVFALIVFWGWLPLMQVAFALLPARRAMLVGVISGWLLLPPLAFDLPGVPEYNKATAVTAGVLLATLIFEPARLVAFRPRWFDIPMVLWCLCPF